MDEASADFPGSAAISESEAAATSASEAAASASEAAAASASTLCLDPCFFPMVLLRVFLADLKLFRRSILMAS